MSVKSLVWLAVMLCFTYGTHSARTPNADIVEEYYVQGAGAGEFSDAVMEDALLRLPDLVRKYRYPFEEHSVTTEDGYILGVHRIRHGRDKNNTPDPSKPVVLVMHGILSSSADFIVMGPGTALAYILAEEGYDVWLGNARGNFFSRNHVSMNPDSNRDDFWNFSWDDIGSKDLPAMIDYILKETGRSRLHYIGHSQGTTVYWVMCSIRPEYNDKIISMQALGPVAYMEHNTNAAFALLAPYSNSIEKFASFVGINELLPSSPFIGALGRTFCRDGALTQPICSNMIFLLAGPGADFHNATMLPVKLSHAPAGISVRQIVHYGQHIRQRFFRRFDHGSLENWRRYRSFSPPLYDLSKITSPVFLHYAEVDTFASLDDVDRLFRELRGAIIKVKVPHGGFSHVDFMWGTQAKALVYDRVIGYMRAVGDH